MQKWAERDQLSLTDWAKRFSSSIDFSSTEGPFNIVIDDLLQKYNLHYNTGLNVDSKFGSNNNLELKKDDKNLKGILFFYFIASINFFCTCLYILYLQTFFI